MPEKSNKTKGDQEWYKAQNAGNNNQDRQSREDAI